MSRSKSSFVTAARRIGIDPEDYAAKREAGLRWCTGCRTWHAESEFGTNAGRGVQRVCRAGRRK